MTRSLISAAALAAATCLTSTALAQDRPQAAGADTPERTAELRARGEAYSRAPDAEQDPAEVSATARLNTQIVAQNEAAALMETRSADAEASLAAELSAEAAAANGYYQADMAAYEAAQAEYLRARAAWEGLMQACVASGRRDCAPAGSAAVATDVPAPARMTPPVG